ncbi:MAG: hypothetical protein ABI878_08600 [Acidobacteriota bacterium]
MNSVLPHVISAVGQTGKKGSDKGIDGIKVFVDDNSGEAKRAIVEVKNGHVKSATSATSSEPSTAKVGRKSPVLLTFHSYGAIVWVIFENDARFTEGELPHALLSIRMALVHCRNEF